MSNDNAPDPNLYIAKEVANNRFKIEGGKPGARLSWQVTGVRHDAYANAHRVPVGEDKAANEGDPLIASTRRVPWEARRAPWFTCLRRCAVDCPRRRVCLAHPSYCLRSFSVFSHGILGTHSTQHGSA